MGKLHNCPGWFISDLIFMTTVRLGGLGSVFAVQSFSQGAPG